MELNRGLAWPAKSRNPPAPAWPLPHSRRSQGGGKMSHQLQWPPYRYEVKGDYIRIIDLSGGILKPLPPTGSLHRTLEIYQAAKECLLRNLQGPLVTPPEYKKLFDTLRLHKLSLELMTIKGKVRGICVVCHKDLQGAQKSYCSDLCRNTAKQRRARDKHPERKLKR